MTKEIRDMYFFKEDVGKHIYKVTQHVPLKIVQYVKVDKSGNESTVFNKWLDKGGIDHSEFSKTEYVDKIIANDYNEITTEIFDTVGSGDHYIDYVGEIIANEDDNEKDENGKSLDDTWTSYELDTLASSPEYKLKQKEAHVDV
mgnify:FL=1|jgi:hypothetical protein|tara:strand:+ start:3439 stop:3870 length:432 start_codon:yes stop_codon:yes gene_type:complete